MAQPAQTFHEPSSGPVAWLLKGFGVLLLLAAAWYLYKTLTDVSGVAVHEASPTMINMLPPPPPPPPPPPQPQDKPPEPQDKPNPEPAPQAAPEKAAPAPAAMQINGPAQAGGDAYNMQSGTGGGMGAPGSNGTCLGANCGKAPTGVDKFWGPNVARALEDHIDKSKRVNIDSFIAQFDIWVTGSGAVSQAKVFKSTGNAQLDSTLLALLQTATGLKPPPPSMKMPQRIKVGRKHL